MIFREMSKLTYRHILQLEIAFLMNYKINPFELFEYMSIKDLNSYMQAIENKLKEEKKNKKQKDLLDSLKAIRDVLNYMFK